MGLVRADFGGIMKRLVVVLAVLPLSACGLFAKPTPTPVPVEIRFAYYARQLTPYYESLKREFEAGHSGVIVVLTETNPYEMLFRGLGAVDVVEIDQRAIAALAERGSLRPLDPIVQGPDGIELGEFYQGTIDAMRWRGQLWGLPLGVDPALLYYNKAIFAAKGVPYPSNEWTWDDLLEAALRLAEPDADPPLYGLVSEARRADFLPLIYQGGGGLLDSPIDPKVATLSSEESVTAMQWYVGLALVHRVMPKPQNMRSLGGMQVLVVSQRAAMWYGNLSERRGLSWDVPWKFEWGVVAQPAGREQTTILFLRACAINQKSEHPRKAWEWVKYLAEHPGGGYDAPTLKGAVEAEEFLAGEQQDVVAAVYQSLTYGQALPPIAWTPDFYFRLDRAITSVFAGTASLEEAMSELDLKLNEGLVQEER